MKYQSAPGSSQQGFLLVQLALFVVLFSGVLAYAGHLYWQRNVRTIADDRARLVGAALANVNDATKTYMTTFFTQIQRGQAVTMGSYTVPASRVRAPTTADLRDLGMLAARSAGPIVYNGVELGFNVAITVDTSGGCVVPTCNLRSVVSSTVPMLDARTGLPDVRRATIAAATASPGNAGVAMPTAMDGNPGIFVSQDGNQVGLNASGTAGVIGIMNGYDSAGFMEFDRRDGSLPRTGSINMQDVMGARHDINRAGAVGAQTVTAEGRIKTGEYLDLDNPIVKEGDTCEKDGLVGRADKGLILSCQSGVWKAAAGLGNLTHYNQLPAYSYAGVIAVNPMSSTYGNCTAGPYTGQYKSAYLSCTAIPPGQCIPCNNNGPYASYIPECEEKWTPSGSICMKIK
ncbi:shufflon system plasmid conjugative transfer pilus tip adhesin PilV [Delftia sp. PS-11]|uniref:shufflon system plasmid conjugative transfer pilus tip adhesin PilV n=1 Tax=Delftia sp. PS-11 TaxID=2767222 RepID=UPI00245409C3|nr:shufflon system plasmid conjugative transfer pilus tip adhesin PilV [Delftia sp. PS-11]KAJ8744163.1 shufflon system plasmid conjugative transfer pilus tip adhesin PilV [Delftia sp. PS-11]